VVYDLLPEKIRDLGVYTVGRLDYHSEGLLIFTNDGEFAQTIGHPSGEITKKYLVEASGCIPYNLIDGWMDGIYIKGERYRIAGYTRLSARKVELVLRERKNREIRKLCRHVSLGIRKLVRVAIGTLEIGDLPSGSWRAITPEEHNALLSEAQEGAVD
jgi:23S rRNA pseudouridine2605 synthase